MYCFVIIPSSNELLSLENMKHPVDGKKNPLIQPPFFQPRAAKDGNMSANFIILVG